MAHRGRLVVAATALAALTACSGGEDGEAKSTAEAACGLVTKANYRGAQSLAHSAAWIDPRWNELAAAADRLVIASTSTLRRGNEGRFRLKLDELNAECDAVQ